MWKVWPEKRVSMMISAFVPPVDGGLGSECEGVQGYLALKHMPNPLGPT